MKTITWKLLLKSNPKTVFDLLTSSEGIVKFWAEKSSKKDNRIHFIFPNGQEYTSRIIKHTLNKEFHIDYFNSLVKFKLESCENGGTELLLINEHVPADDYVEVSAGWVSVLMNLKAVADFNCDLRNHNDKKTWSQGYINN